MKWIFRCLFPVLLSALSLPAFAGGPEIEIDRARIDELVEVHGGRVVLRASGIAKLFAPNTGVPGLKKGADPWVRLPMDTAEITILGETLYTPSVEGAARWKERLQAMVGTDQRIQLWGTTATLQHGRVTHITATVAHPFSPIHDERRFDLAGLAELEVKVPETAETTEPIPFKVGFTRAPIRGLEGKEPTGELESNTTWLSGSRLEVVSQVDDRELACPAYAVIRVDQPGWYEVKVWLRATGNRQILGYSPMSKSFGIHDYGTREGKRSLRMRLNASDRPYLVLSCTDGHLFLDQVTVKKLAKK